MPGSTTGGRHVLGKGSGERERGALSSNSQRALVIGRKVIIRHSSSVANFVVPTHTHTGRPTHGDFGAKKPRTAPQSCTMPPRGARFFRACGARNAVRCCTMRPRLFNLPLRRWKNAAARLWRGEKCRLFPTQLGSFKLAAELPQCHMAWEALRRR